MAEHIEPSGAAPDGSRTGLPATVRMPTGIPGLDDILLGGFVRDGLYIVQGMPGSGKTIFANQVCYAHITAGGRALYVTLLSEQHERMLANLGQLSFCDTTRIGRELSYVSAFQTLEREGLPGLLTLIRREIVSHAASVLVIDGLLAAGTHAGTNIELKKFVHELQMLSATGDCTMFLLTSGTERAVAPEHTMVDGMIEIGMSEFGWRVERDLLVRKFRASGYLSGRHAMRITGHGIVIWPRTEARGGAIAGPAKARAPRVLTGVAGLDGMLNGGLPAGSSTIVLGPTGTGKTVLGLQFLAQSTADEPGLLLGFYESPEELLARAELLAPALPPLVRDGTVDIVWQCHAEDLIDRVADDLLARVRQRGVRRLVIDSLLGFNDMTVQPDRMPAFYRALSAELRALGVTVLATMEAPELVGPTLHPPISRLTPVAENLILLRYVEQRARLTRLISVLKVRDSLFDPRLRAFEIVGAPPPEAGGIVVGNGFEADHGGHAGQPRPQSGLEDEGRRAAPREA